jgi:hypothetical protein
MREYRQGFELLIGFIGNLHFVTTSNNNSSLNYIVCISLQYSKHKVFSASCVFISPVVTGSNGRVTLPLGLRTVPVSTLQEFSANASTTTTLQEKFTTGLMSLFKEVV